MTSIGDGWECPFSAKSPAPGKNYKTPKKDFGRSILGYGTWRCKLGRNQTLHPHRLLRAGHLVQHHSLTHLLSIQILQLLWTLLCWSYKGISSRNPTQHQGIHIGAGWRTTIAFSRKNVLLCEMEQALPSWGAPYGTHQSWEPELKCFQGFQQVGLLGRHSSSKAHLGRIKPWSRLHSVAASIPPESNSHCFCKQIWQIGKFWGKTEQHHSVEKSLLSSSQSQIQFP